MEAYAVAQSIFDGVARMRARLTAEGFTQTVRTHVLVLHPETHKLLARGSIVYELDNRVPAKSGRPRFRGYEIVECVQVRRTQFRLIPHEWWEAVVGEWSHAHTPDVALTLLSAPLTGSPLGDYTEVCENCRGAGRFREESGTYLLCHDCYGTGIDVDWECVEKRELPGVLSEEKGV